MSSRFDEYMDGSFEYGGKYYRLIIPKNLEDLMRAYHVLEIAKEKWSGLMHDEEDETLSSFMQEQEDNIQEYIDSLEDFYNGIFIKNLTFLLKKNGMKMGELESILGVSAGYVSRTAKENSGKKMSIDSVWKIAKLFGISIDKLVGDDLTLLTGNVGMLVDFMDKLTQQTKTVSIEWDNYGVYETAKMNTLLPYEELSLFYKSEAEGGQVLYRRDTFDPDNKFFVAGDVIATSSLDPSKDLFIIPFRKEDEEDVHYDFLFFWKVPGSGKPDMEKVFSTYDDTWWTLDEHAGILYREAMEHLMDVPISEDIRNFITDYLA